MPPYLRSSCGFMLAKSLKLGWGLTMRPSYSDKTIIRSSVEQAVQAKGDFGQARVDLVDEQPVARLHGVDQDAVLTQ